ncbi:polysaccharide biosynthesis/export family protein [Natronohydrobacter thiooxidans]|uniref:polysaccharide biosynthesis/export family protein n=1 Tax=Natronohydrobacter thiooxidans TaxID=87172 RepID=UPI000AAD4A4F|nr:polysaccharide biosynthesis/export family protein [Natronohydrobacter thiooxidans]
MTAKTMTMGRRMALFAAVAAIASCAVSRDGPTKREIYEGSVMRSGDAHVVLVTKRVSHAANRPESLGFSHALRSGALMGGDTIRPGDVISLNVYENVPEGLLAPETANNAIVEELQVDDAGFIFVPYAGRIRAAGHTPDALRRILTSALDEQTPDPQVVVARAQGDGATVSVTGGVTAQGVYPVGRATNRLSSMIATAGGISIPLETAQVLVTRGNRQDSAWLQDIFSNPSLDIAMRPGDRILVRQDQRAFSVLGATGTSNRVTFDSRQISAIDALAMVGGLDPLRADPTGVFVFRDEVPEVATEILGIGKFVTDVRFVYVLDLTAPTGMFNARDFKIRDGDTIFVTEAASVLWARQISALTGSLTAAGAARRVARGGTD